MWITFFTNFKKTIKNRELSFDSVSFENTIKNPLSKKKLIQSKKKKFLKLIKNNLYFKRHVKLILEKINGISNYKINKKKIIKSIRIDKNNYVIKKAIKNLKNTIILYYKSQLRSSMLSMGMLKKTITNGIIVKKLGLLKLQKKNDKISFFNLSDLLSNVNGQIVKKSDYLLIIVKNLSSKLNKIVKFFRKKINSQTIWTLHTKISFSKKKEKRIKSIKKKLTKKYNYIKNN